MKLQDFKNQLYIGICSGCIAGIILLSSERFTSNFRDKIILIVLIFGVSLFLLEKMINKLSKK